MFTNKEIKQFYEKYKNADVVFNKDVINATGLEMKQTFIKYSDMQRACALYSASMVDAKVFSTLKTSIAEEIKSSGDRVHLRLAFKRADGDRKELLTFFITSKITRVSLHDSVHVNTIYLSYQPQPPSVFVEILGELLEAKANAEKRKEERVILNPSSMRRLGLVSSNSYVWIDEEPRKCIVRDLSFIGAKILIIGVAKYFADKKIVLRLNFEDYEPLEIHGVVIRNEEVVGRQDVAAIGISFDEKNIPTLYEIRLNEFLKRTNPRKS